MILHAVAEVADGFDESGTEFSAESGDEDFHRVRVAIEALGINMFGEFALRDDATTVVHEIGEHAEFVAGEIYLDAFDGNFAGAWIENERTAVKFRIDLPASPA